MAVTPARDLKFGRILEETFDVVERNAVVGVIFIVALGLLNGGIAYFGADYTAFTQTMGKQFITFLIGVVAAFLLLSAMLRQASFIGRIPDDQFLPYVGLSVLTGIGVMIGFLLIIFPGLFLMARWSICQPVLLAKNKGVIESMKESWERTAGSEFSIIMVVLILVLLQVGVSFLVTRAFDPTSLLGIGIGQVVGGGLSVVSAAMGVALFKLLVIDRDGAEVKKTFD